MREELFQREPLCANSYKHGPRLATQRDHKIPLAEGGLDELSNTQGLCDDCHAEKSAAEARRGRGGSNL